MPDPVFEENVKRMENRQLARKIWPFIRPYGWMLGLSTLLVFVVTASELMLPMFTQKVFDGFIVPVNDIPGTRLFGINITSLKAFGIFLAIFVAISFLIDFIQTLFMEYTGQKIILNLRCELFNHMTALPVSFFDKNSSGRLVARVAGDVENMNEMFTSILIFIFKDLFLMAGILVILFFIDTTLAAYLSLLVPVIALSIAFFSKILRTAFRNIRQKIAEINHSFSEAVSGIKIIQIITSQDHFFSRFSHLNAAHHHAALFQIKIFSVFMPFIGFLGVISIAVILWVASSQVIEKTLSLGELVAFLTYMKLFFRPLRELSEKFNLLQNALASAERIILVLEAPGAASQARHSEPALTQINHLCFKKIDFAYTPGKAVLKQVSFSLSKGESIGIVGPTGSGKSSIINLITGFYPPRKGTIEINGMDHNSIPIEAIRSKTALVMQDPILFSGTIRENIQPSGLPGTDRTASKDDERLSQALKKAHCDFLFAKFNGLDTQIEEGGKPLSSGEKQLVCIARAFAFDPDLIIFDEATSYMDSQSEQIVHDAMNNLMKGRLSIIIAHRLSTVRACDSILFLKDGIIREQGTHSELVDIKGEYYHLLLKEKI